jgi:hypothetical protein
MSWMRKSAMTLAAPTLALGIAGATLGTSTPASAAESTITHTYQGTIMGAGGVDRTLSCPNDVAAGYFVKGVGENRTRIDADVSAPDFLHVFIARDTEAYAFLSRIVLSVTVHLETVPFAGPGPHNYRVTIACVSLASSAWRVFG